MIDPRFCRRPAVVCCAPRHVRLGPAALVIAAFMAVAAPAPVFAQGGYPASIDPYVNDFARLLTPNDAAAIRTLFAGLKRDKNIEAVVVTIYSRNDYRTADAAIESFATNLFNAWGVGDKVRNNGVMILVAAKDREVRIEVGAGYGAQYDGKMQAIVNGKMLPRFRANEYSGGIRDGAQAVAEALTAPTPPKAAARPLPPAKAKAGPGSFPAEAFPASVPVAASQSALLAEATPTRDSASVTAGAPPAKPGPVRPPAAGTASSPRAQALRPGHSSASRGEGISPVAAMGGGALALLAMVVVLLVSRAARKRRCPQCQTDMTRLDEFSDDMYLDSGQKIEERLNSVDYVVWKCPSCGMHAMDRVRRWFSSYSDCPKCGFRTLGSTCETLVPPTYASTGRKRISYLCRHCNHQSEDIVILPMLVRSEPHHHGSSFQTSFGSSHDSHGSSPKRFGGGSSSGHGASGKW